MRPSSSGCEARAGGLFDGVLARGSTAAAVTDSAWLQALLDAEAALARAAARAGRIPGEHADAIAAACRAEAFDAGTLGAQAAASGNPVVPLVRALTAAVPGAAAGSVHVGATSQDILDTGAMLVVARSLQALLGDLRGAAEAAAGLARQHRDTLLPARTLLQQALPTTFGLKAAGWLVALDEAAARLEALRRTTLAVQLGGAAGTLASLGADGTQVLRFFADELGMAEPVLPWHTNRTRVVEVAGGLGLAGAALAKVARDVVLLSQTEVGEVREGGGQGRGGSSTLPHKRNPVAAVSAAACAGQVPGLVAALLWSAGNQEHERGAGTWQAEWRPLTGLLAAVGSAAAWVRDCLEHLDVDAARMRANLDLVGELLLAEHVTATLTPALGRLAAHDLVAQACATAVSGERSLAAALGDLDGVTAHLDAHRISALLDPAGYLGSAHAFVDRALAAHQAAGGPPGNGAGR